jgi:hypothetical protein
MVGQGLAACRECVGLVRINYGVGPVVVGPVQCLVPRLTVGIFWGYLGILGDKNRQFVQVIKGLILVVIVSYTDLLTQDIKTFSTIYYM